ncbi:MAG TPA: protealysin inhibitor emfourin [Anaerolineae bacterium]|nr:protealysin inhibitor emfourin [Anaerolineae bacterium]
MRIEFERSGGFAGIQLAVSVDTEDLNPRDAELLESAVASAAFSQLPPRLLSAAPGADRFQYNLAVEEGDQRHEVQVGEAAIPDTLRPLIEHMSVLARTGRLR